LAGRGLQLARGLWVDASQEVVAEPAEVVVVVVVVVADAGGVSLSAGAFGDATSAGALHELGGVRGGEGRDDPGGRVVEGVAFVVEARDDVVLDVEAGGFEAAGRRGVEHAEELVAVPAEVGVVLSFLWPAEVGVVLSFRRRRRRRRRRAVVSVVALAVAHHEGRRVPHVLEVIFVHELPEETPPGLRPRPVELEPRLVVENPKQPFEGRRVQGVVGGALSSSLSGVVRVVFVGGGVVPAAALRRPAATFVFVFVVVVSPPGPREVGLSLFVAPGLVLDGCLDPADVGLDSRPRVVELRRDGALHLEGLPLEQTPRRVVGRLDKTRFEFFDRRRSAHPF